MGPEDATALLLALMYDDELASASLNVSRLLQARFGGSTRVGKCAAKELPHHSFLRTDGGEIAPFGDVLVNLLDWWTRHGSICEDDAPDGSDRSVYNLTIEVQSPGHIVSVRFNTHETMWNIRYHWKPPEQVAYEAAGVPPGHDFRPRWDALNGPYLWSSRTVSEDSLTLIADCLRGHEWREADEEVSPSYERVAAAAEVDT